MQHSFYFSKSLNRRKSHRTSIVAVKSPPGPRLTFQWSQSASQWSLCDESLSSIDTDRSHPSSFLSSNRSSGRVSPRGSINSTQESVILPRLKTKKQREASTHQQSSVQQPQLGLPLILTFNQLHRPVTPPPAKPRRSTVISIQSPTSPKTTPEMKRKVSSTSHSSIISISYVSSSSLHPPVSTYLIPSRTFNDKKKLRFHPDKSHGQLIEVS